MKFDIKFEFLDPDYVGFRYLTNILSLIAFLIKTNQLVKSDTIFEFLNED